MTLHMEHTQYTVERELANAIFGKILLCYDRRAKRRVVVKRVQVAAANARRSWDAQRAVTEHFAFEKRVHLELSRGHEHLVALHETFTVGGFDHLVMEYCPRGDLFLRVQKSHRLPPKEAHLFFGQIARAVAYMHARGYAHGDLSLENVFLDAHGQCKLGDFGLAALLHEPRVATAGKYFYMAPEMFATQGYNPEKADVWALGIMATTTDGVYRFYVHAQCLERILDGWNVADVFAPDLLDLLSQMLSVDPARRPTMAAVVAHPYVATAASSQRFPHVRRLFASLFRRRGA
ncbi:serine/threonine protein kinase [Saprolegnia parasitica CBS 223.65]|uniref:Serine/threonine protein kinase n=1 Tax=Saprolegnia parasitica (strain CBS 223.65) TaxID=695850 RepID=A0A067CHU0_SAPPC|nr:serine/threonine protein kinase [Saprolegnia parasitica CBS 223.65]KDO28725.1 serine/threonine protein kinase [Saprolegnia parasitica CBS 223.65]|eukprot:XP_012200365.1 serine/threonine protein kinase [Saprolegnia parasitica CBS 223.65]